MHILIVSHYFWPETFRINAIAKHLSESGHTIDVLTGVPTYPKKSFFKTYGYGKPFTEKYGEITIKRMPVFTRGEGKRWRLALNYLTFFLYGCTLGIWRCWKPYHVIFIFSPSPITVALPALLLKALKKIPIVLWVQDVWPETLSAMGVVKLPWLLKIIDALARFIYKGCDVILGQSQGFKTLLEKKCDKPVLYFPNPAEAIYEPMTLPMDAPERALLPKGFIVLFAGNIGTAQDFPTILSAAMKLQTIPDVHFIIIGDGSQWQWLKEEIPKKKLTNMHLLGRYPLESMPRFFALADVLLVTLQARPAFTLTTPSKVQSYLACGKPIVAALEGEGAKIIEAAEAGVVVPPENPKALSDAIMSLKALKSMEREAMGTSGRKYFDVHFHSDTLGERLENILMDLCQRKGVY